MSVIGPRPLLVEYLPYYTKEEHHRHDVRPGLSGWAQINGRNAIDSWEQRFQYDLEYVKNVSFAFDIMIACDISLNLFKSFTTLLPKKVVPFSRVGSYTMTVAPLALIRFMTPWILL